MRLSRRAAAHHCNVAIAQATLRGTAAVLRFSRPGVLDARVKSRPKRNRQGALWLHVTLGRLSPEQEAAAAPASDSAKASTWRAGSRCDAQKGLI